MSKEWPKEATVVFVILKRWLEQTIVFPKFCREWLKETTVATHICKECTNIPRESFCESEEGVRLPRETADPGEVPSGEVWETSGEPLDCYSVPQRENFRGSRRKTSGEVRGTSGEVRGLSRSSGEPDSLPATRQICLQYSEFYDLQLHLVSRFQGRLVYPQGNPEKE